MLSTTVEYAMRSLSCLARAPEGEALLGRELAELADVPANYLSKILLVLKRAGIVEATRGTGGGYRLARPAVEIVLGEVVELFDPPRAHPGCFLGRRECSDEDPCAAHDNWRRVRTAYLDFLQNTTLDQIIRPADGGHRQPPVSGVPEGR